MDLFKTRMQEDMEKYREAARSSNVKLEALLASYPVSLKRVAELEGQLIDPSEFCMLISKQVARVSLWKTAAEALARPDSSDKRRAAIIASALGAIDTFYN